MGEDSYRRSIERVLGTIPSAHNRETVGRYLAEREANGIKPGTRLNDANALRGLCEALGAKRLEDGTKEDIVAYVNQASRERVWAARTRDGQAVLTRGPSRVGPRSMGIRRIILRQFYKWLRGTDDYPPEVRFIKSPRANPDRLPTDAILTSNDMRALLRAHPDPREQALFAVLYESGLRAGEFCSLNISSVEFHDEYANLTLPKGAPGLKTGSRRILLFDSVPYLQRWMEIHPFRDQPVAALFFTMSRRAPRARITPGALNGICHRGALKAGLTKRVHPHLFRHTAATERARQGWNEAQMRSMFGWTSSSDMPSTYVHLAGKDYEEMELERRGLLRREERARGALEAIVCRRCQTRNPPTGAFCRSCRAPIAPEALEELDRRRREEIMGIVSKVMGDVIQNFVDHGLVFPSMTPLEGVTGEELEREHLAWIRRRRREPDAPPPPTMVRPIRRY